MPRIKAATIAEHRETQRRVLVDAARAIVLRDGASGLRFGDLSEQTGVARPTIYDYFKTREDLLAAVIQDEMPRWEAAVTAAVEQARSPAAKIEAFVSAHLRYVAAGGHSLAFALAAGPLDDQSTAAIDSRHAHALGLLADPIAALGLDPDAVLPLFGGMLASVTRVLHAHPPSPKTVATATTMLVGAIRAVRRVRSTNEAAGGKPSPSRSRSRKPRRDR